MADDQAKISICNLTEVFGMTDEQKTMPCGCVTMMEFVDELDVTNGMQIQRIHFCPLHTKAQEMYEALKAIPKDIRINNDREDGQLVQECYYCGGTDIFPGEYHHESCHYGNAQVLLKEISDDS